MTRTGLLQCGWLCLVVGAMTWSALASGRREEAWQPPSTPAPDAERASGAEPRSPAAIADAGGHLVPLKPYAHIASGSSLTDALLLVLAEPHRIAALTAYGRQHSPQAHLYGRRPVIDGGNVEELVVLGVDLLIVTHLGAPDELARVRDAGIAVFDLGQMRGLRTLLPNIRTVAALLGAPERGERFARDLVRRMSAVAADIRPGRRKRAVYFSAHGGQLFGGGRHTSYHDVLTHAGLIDVSAARYKDFPQYDPEQILLMDPDIVVTHLESRDMVCRVNGLERLRACRDGGKGVIGLEGALIGDPGPRMLQAAEALRDLAYGPLPAR